jgi:hypothetical protein
MAWRRLEQHRNGMERMSYAVAKRWIERRRYGTA